MYIRKEPAVFVPDDTVRAKHRGTQQGQGVHSNRPKGCTGASWAEGYGKNSRQRKPNVQPKRTTEQGRGEQSGVRSGFQSCLCRAMTAPLSLSGCKVSTLHSDPVKYLLGLCEVVLGQGEGTPLYATAPSLRAVGQDGQETHPV